MESICINQFSTSRDEIARTRGDLHAGAGRTRIHGMPGQRLLHRQALHDDCRLLRIAEILWRQCTPRRPH